MAGPVYQWRILQDGDLPIAPDGTRRFASPHRCTSTLIWPAGQEPSREDTLLVDPAFNHDGSLSAAQRLASLGITVSDIGACFITHRHGDHCLLRPDVAQIPEWDGADPPPIPTLSGIRAVNTPGHERGHRVLRFSSSDGDTWVSGDAIIGEDWLRAWQYYWPNGYDREQIIRTWVSVATIMQYADLIIPGHSAPFPVTAGLLESLIADFASASYHEDCPELPGLLRERLRRMEGEG